MPNVYLREYIPIRGHDCPLHQRADYLAPYINSGWCVGFRRRLKATILINDTNPLCRAIFKSASNIAHEKDLHLRYHYHIIHPFSSFSFYWNMLMIVGYIGALLATPFMMVAGISDTRFSYFFYVLNYFCGLDIIIRFVTGYYDYKKGKTILALSDIVKHYIETYLVFDLVAFAPFCHIFHIHSLSKFTSHGMNFTFFNHSLRLVRIPTCFQYISDLNKKLNVPTYKLNIFKIIILLTIMKTWISCYYATQIVMDYNEPPEDFTALLLNGLYYSTLTVFLIAPWQGHVDTKMHQYVAQIFMLNFANLVNCILLAIILRIYNRIGFVDKKYERLRGQLFGYAKYKELPDTMRKTMFQYIDFKFQKRIYNEEFIFSTIAPHMKEEIFLHSCKNLVESVDIFQDLPTSAITRIALRLKQEICLPNDVIVQAGYEGSSMYFLIVGTVSVYTSSGREVCHLSEGSHFGEIALVMKETRTASIVAVDFCELLVLKRKDFQEAIDPFPELKTKILEIAQSRMTNLPTET